MAGICDTCHAGCCRTYHLLITAYDALVIARDLGLPVGEFTTFLAANGENIKRIGGKHTPIKFADPGQEENRFFIALKRVNSALIPGTLKCYFLQEWQRQDVVAERGDHSGAKIIGRCGIYDSRPQMCKTYPAALHTEGALGFIATPPPTPLSDQNKIYEICPEKWTPEAFAQDPSKMLHTLVLTSYEVDFQSRAVAEWNAKPGLAKEFFPFMHRVYGIRFRLGGTQTVENPPDLKTADGSPVIPSAAPAANPPPPAP